jgi:opacity protein-like surface antigen
MNRTLLASFIAVSMTMGVAGAAHASDWGGAYAGVSLGYSTLGGDFYDNDQNYFNSGKDSADRGNGGFLGVQLGYNVENANLVYGVEADMMGNFANNAESSPDDNGYCTTPIFDADMTGKGSLRGRLGMTTGSNDLFYVTGGAAFAKINQRHFDCESRGRHSALYTGWTLGVGWEHMVGSSVSMRVAADYTGFKKKNWTDQTDENFGLDPNVITVGASVNFHF